MTESNCNGKAHADVAALERFLNEWALKIHEPTIDEQAEVIASRLRLNDRKKPDPIHDQA